ncbi:MAG: 7-cyano-7-deazaguanine synthase [Bifidobacteriaceae bacterium]|jgi:7-cyano-7-deazaguanine synthase|nr:7-cyano-7-deazaguanine synthase [Bifidobacteriaceae bacterium]
MVTREAVTLLSGGFDSALTLSLLLDSGWASTALFVNYGQIPVRDERAASRSLASYFQVEWRETVVQGIQATPFAEIPSRNDLLLSIAAAACPRRSLAIGIHAGTDFLDCSVPYARAWQHLLDAQFNGVRRILAPLINMTKAEVLALGSKLQLPTFLTYSCEDQGGPCGVCRSCRDSSQEPG